MGQEERNLKVVEDWIGLYNTDTTRMAREIYAPDFVVHAMGLATVEGTDNLIRLEDAVNAAAPDRIGRIERARASGDTVTVEAVLTYSGTNGEKIETPFCAILTFRDGKIITDRTYLDRTLWPGL